MGDVILGGSRPVERLRCAADLIEQVARGTAREPVDPWAGLVREQLVPWCALMTPDLAAPLVAWLRVTADRAERFAFGHLACAESLALADLILHRPPPRPHPRKDPPVTAVHTRVHTRVEFANPYLQCDECQGWVTAWHDNFRCGCRTPCDNKPCGHAAGVTSACPSWGPVDGCQCLAHLGHVPHAEPAPPLPGGVR